MGQDRDGMGGLLFGHVLFYSSLGKRKRRRIMPHSFPRQEDGRWCAFCWQTLSPRQLFLYDWRKKRKEKGKGTGWVGTGGIITHMHVACVACLPYSFIVLCYLCVCVPCPCTTTFSCNIVPMLSVYSLIPVNMHVYGMCDNGYACVLVAWCAIIITTVCVPCAPATSPACPYAFCLLL